MAAARAGIERDLDPSDPEARVMETNVSMEIREYMQVEKRIAMGGEAAGDLGVVAKHEHYITTIVWLHFSEIVSEGLDAGALASIPQNGRAYMQVGMAFLKASAHLAPPGMLGALKPKLLASGASDPPLPSPEEPRMQANLHVFVTGTNHPRNAELPAPQEEATQQHTRSHRGIHCLCQASADVCAVQVNWPGDNRCPISDPIVGMGPVFEYAVVDGQLSVVLPEEGVAIEIWLRTASNE